VPIFNTEIRIYVLLYHSHYNRTWYAHSTLKVLSNSSTESRWSTDVANTLDML